MTNIILKLGHSNRQFPGILTRPSSGPLRGSWLMCRPYGQEAVRSAPLYRVISERLAQAGYAVLRFDYWGCGDAPGDFVDRHLDHMVADSIVAFEALQRAAPSQNCAWFGLSLGGTVAALAAAKGLTTPKRLALWEPVTDGAEYCCRLLQTHRHELAVELQSDWSDLTAVRGLEEPAIPGSVLGWEIGARFAAQLKALRALPLAALLARRIEVDLATASHQHEIPEAIRTHPGFRVSRGDSSINWMNSEAESTALAPQEIVRFVVGAS